MAASNTIELGELQLHPGEARRIELPLAADFLSFGGERYRADAQGPAILDVSRMAAGHSFHLRFECSVSGPCMRCLEQASVAVTVEAREVDQPGGGEELDSPYVEDERLRAGDWAHDALVLALPTQLVCREDCEGLCPVCGEPLRGAAPGAHDHPREPDPRWEALRELKLD
jgi:uncharacterized protein